jgi:tryptophan-rich sensory protein
MKGSSRIGGLVFWVGLSLLAGVAGSRWMPGEWYAALAKPDWNPPNWIFAPVWTSLYVLMGVAAWMVWVRAGWARGRAALGSFLLQLLLNALWSYLFFGAHLMGWALVEIVGLGSVILVTIIFFARHSTTAATLLVPYLLWVTFATILNTALWRLNPEA